MSSPSNYFTFVGTVAFVLGFTYILDRYVKNMPVTKVYCYANGKILNWLKQHGPYIEASAGMGWLSHKLQRRGVDSLAFDLNPPVKTHHHITQAANGTFEDQYPDRTLLIAHGFETEASVLKYTG